MTSAINDNLLPPLPPTAEELANDSIEENIQITPEALNIHTYVHQYDTQHQYDTHEEEIILHGQFNYIKEYWVREMLVNAWQAITITKMWNFVREPIESFMFSDDPRVKIISEKMEELGYFGHSGTSFGCTMRAMQYIAKYGEKKFREEQI